SLDPSLLEVVYRDQALIAAQSFIEELRTQGRAVQVSVSHDYDISLLDETTAVVQDRYTDSSSFVDPETGASIDSSEPEVFFELSTFELREGQWVFVSVSRP
ncbi:MAG TPA: hypothetical protein VK866_15925, partial [Acidimicrobiales bacterium]|nr:hypothetical protein [Acidimicrobiales bacterium]